MPEFLVEEAKSAGPYSAPPSRRSSGGFGGRDYREGYSRGGLGAVFGGAVGGKSALYHYENFCSKSVRFSRIIHGSLHGTL